jgi:hypothetical protein
MRFSIVAAAFMATFVAADYTSTASVTVTDTITSCGPEVTNCPARTSTVALSSSTPIYANVSTPAKTTTSAPYVAPVSSVSVNLATSYITTCIPTVITSVYTVTPSPSVVVKASSTAGLTYAKNSTLPAATSTPTQFTGSASNVQGSVVVAAVAGLAAFLFA